MYKTIYINIHPKTMSFSSSSSSGSNDDVDTLYTEDDPLYGVLSKFLLTPQDRNVATVLSDICIQLTEINVSLKKIALANTSVSPTSTAQTS